jgi:hypothetical protein
MQYNPVAAVQYFYQEALMKVGVPVHGAAAPPHPSYCATHTNMITHFDHNGMKPLWVDFLVPGVACMYTDHDGQGCV